MFLFDLAIDIHKLYPLSKFQLQTIISSQVIAKRKNKRKSADSQYKTIENAKITMENFD